MEWEKAPDVKREVVKLARQLDFKHISLKRVYCFRSRGSTSRARARIWSLPRIWQQALQTQSGYCLEVISEKFDKLSDKEKKQILIHELLHIPKTFSGSLLPHRNRRGDWLEKKARKLAKEIDK